MMTTSPTTPTKQKMALSIDEVAEAIGVSKDVVYQYARSGKLPARKIGRRWIISRTRLEAWVATTQQELAALDNA